MNELIDSQIEEPEPVIEPMKIRAPRQFHTTYDDVKIPVDALNTEPVPTGQKIRTPAQFAQGGMVTPNIDRFLQSLGS